MVLGLPKIHGAMLMVMVNRAFTTSGASMPGNVDPTDGQDLGEVPKTTDS